MPGKRGWWWWGGGPPRRHVHDSIRPIRLTVTPGLIKEKQKVMCMFCCISLQDIFDELVNTHAYDGTYRASDDTVRKCLDSCLADPACLAVDFNGGCFVHTNRDNLADLNTGATGVNHYRRMRDPDCADVTPTGGTGPTGPAQCTLQNTYSPVQRNTGDTRYPSGNLPRLSNVSGRTVQVNFYCT